MGYTAYVRSNAGPAAKRPIAFCYNGGPGSSSLWLHMGVLGPRRVVVSDPTPTPAGSPQVKAIVEPTVRACSRGRS